MDQTIKIRVSAEDKSVFEASAEALGLSLSAWARLAMKSTAASPPGALFSGADQAKIIDRDVLKILSAREGDTTISGAGIKTGVFTTKNGVPYIDPKGIKK